MILVIKDGMILCQDKMWRHHAPFGNMSCCARVYKRLGRAKEIANHQNATLEYHKKPATVKVAVVPAGFSVNAASQVSDASDNPVGTLDNFTVPLK